MKNKTKVIFHIDLNAFYASCHMIEEPYLEDVPFIVGGSAVLRRGIVLTASYKARAFGIRSGMNVKDAMDMCKTLRVIPPKFQLYMEHSHAFFNFLESWSPRIMKASIDEAYMDMTHHENPLEVAKEIQNTLLKTYQLPSSIGIASTLFLAKMASDMKKPLGLTVLRKKDIVEMLFKEPIESLYGLGKKTYPHLIEKGIKTIGAFTLKEFEHHILDVMSSHQYQDFLNHIYGNSTNIISTDYEQPKSISQETTFNYAMDESELIKDVMRPLIDEVIKRLHDKALLAKTVGFKYKDENFNSKTRSKTLLEQTSEKNIIEDAIFSLFDFHYDHIPIRLIGVYVLTYQEVEMFNLFTYERFIKN